MVGSNLPVFLRVVKLERAGAGLVTYCSGSDVFFRSTPSDALATRTRASIPATQIIRQPAPPPHARTALGSTSGAREKGHTHTHATTRHATRTTHSQAGVASLGHLFTLSSGDSLAPRRLPLGSGRRGLLLLRNPVVSRRQQRQQPPEQGQEAASPTAERAPPPRLVPPRERCRLRPMRRRARAQGAAAASRGPPR